MKQLLFIGMFLVMMVSNSCKEKTNVNVNVDETPAVDNTSTAADGTYVIDPQSSDVKWKGSKPTGVHNGIVPISGGQVTVTNGMVTGGTVEIDMTGITDLDLEGEMKANLEAHLKGRAPGKENDFFNVDKYPKATYVINSVSKLDNDPDGTHMVNGTLTIKDISKPINFKANINIDGNKLSATTPEFGVDRTEFDIQFKSKKFFTNLQDDFINDEFTLQINVNANKQ
jgi:polyisoprenoid-binding protein YceI